MSKGLSGSRAQTLVDAFYHVKDQQLLNEFRNRMAKMDQRAQLAAASGIDDEGVLDRLIELDIGPETLAALAVIPLIQVAWADGKVQSEERKAIIRAAQESSVKSGGNQYLLIDYWLDKKPGREMFEAWEHYIQALCQQLEPDEIAELKHDVLTLARKIARAAGGMLGIKSKISKAEREVLDQLEKFFHA